MMVSNVNRGVVLRLVTGAFVCLLAGWLPMAAIAKCSALPNLSGMLEHIDTLASQRSLEDTARTGRKIEALRQQIERGAMAKTLSDFGMQRGMPDIIEFKVKTGALTTIATNGGPELLKPYLQGSGYKRSLQKVHSIVERICDLSGGTAPSNAATRQISESGSGALHRLSAPLLGASVLTVIVGLVLAFMIRKARAKRDARANRRTACAIPVRVTGRAGAHRLRVVDISVAGVNLAEHPDIEEQDMLTLDFGPFSQDAIVRWHNDHFAGLFFTQQITEKQLSHLLEECCTFSASQKKRRGTRMGTAPEPLYT
jgi:hypothetical protein